MGVWDHKLVPSKSTCPLWEYPYGKLWNSYTVVWSLNLARFWSILLGKYTLYLLLPRGLNGALSASYPLPCGDWDLSGVWEQIQTPFANYPFLFKLSSKLTSTHFHLAPGANLCSALELLWLVGLHRPYYTPRVAWLYVLGCHVAGGDHRLAGPAEQASQVVALVPACLHIVAELHHYDVGHRVPVLHNALIVVYQVLKTH